MNTMQIDFIDPKVKKVILGLQTMGLIKLTKTTNDELAPELSTEFIERLDKEYELYKSGKGKFYTMSEVFNKYIGK
jgi:hypothetical protein